MSGATAARGAAFKEDHPGCPPGTVCASDPQPGSRAFLDMTQIVYVGVPGTVEEAGSGALEKALEDFEPLFKQ